MPQELSMTWKMEGEGDFFSPYSIRRTANCNSARASVLPLASSRSYGGGSSTGMSLVVLAANGWVNTVWMTYVDVK